MNGPGPAPSSPSVRVKKAPATPAADAAVRDDLGEILGSSLPKATEQFCNTYRQLGGATELLDALPPIQPATRLSQVLSHLRDVSWRQGLTDVQQKCLGTTLGEALPAIRNVIESVAAIDFKAYLEKGGSADAFVSAVALGLEVCTLYCTLVGVFGVPISLVVEEVGVALVSCLKHCSRQLATPLLSSPGECSASDQVAAAALRDHEEALCCVAALARVMTGVSEFLSRHRLGDEHLHQLVHMAMSFFFFSEPNFAALAGAENLLVIVFSRYDSLQTSILQDFFVKVPKLPSGKRARKFQVPAAHDSPDFGLSSWTHLLLRLVQSSCLPLHEPIGSAVDFAAVVNCRAAGQSVLAQLTSGLMQRLLFTRTRDEELRATLEELLDELLSVAFKPAWPAAIAWIRTFVSQLIGIIQSEKKKVSVDHKIKEFALKLLCRIAARLCHHHVDVTRGMIVLPRWDEPIEKTPREERLLQHIALRVSLEQGDDMPWIQAARAMEAWDAELFLKHSHEDRCGLASLTDDMVFRYLALAHLEDERFVHAKVPPMKTGGPTEALSACVFPAGHPVHAWTFLVCDWAETAKTKAASDARPSGSSQEKGDADTSKRKTGSRMLLERFLAGAWTSHTPLCGEGSTWRSGGGRRVLLPFTVYKIYRQLRCMELDGLRKAVVDCLVLQANSPLASMRKTAMRGLSDVIDADSSVLSCKPVEETIDMRLQDESAWVRQVTLDLLGRILEVSLGTTLEDGENECWAMPPAPEDGAQASDKGAAASAMLLRFNKTVRGRINDTSVLVRRQASKMLSAFVLNHPEHQDVEDVALDLLRRSMDSSLLRNLVVGTFELLWFADDEPTPKQARQLSRVVDASRSMGTRAGDASRGDILSELLERFRKNMSNRKSGKGFDHAIRRWTTVLLHEFVQFNGGVVAPDSSGSRLSPQDRWIHRRSLLAALEAFAITQPREMLIHLRPLTVYLALEDDSTPEEQWIALKVCQILSVVLPYAAERRGLMDHRQVQEDLQILIKNQPSSGVHEAVRCLCLIVKYVTGDLGQLLVHLNGAIPALSHLSRQGASRPGSLERIQQMYMSRQVWVLASLLEGINVDDFIEKPGAARNGRFLPRSSLRFEMVGGSVASTVADLLVRLYELRLPQIRAVVITCLGFFLQGQRSYVKELRIQEIFADAFAAPDLGLRLKAMEALATLLTHFSGQAEQETQNSGVSKAAKSTDSSSAVESAQPLSAYSGVVLEHITVGAVAIANGNGADGSDVLSKIRAEALRVVRLLHQQGLVNPMLVLPKIFALCFVPDAGLNDLSSAMLKDMLDLRPTLLLNRMEEAFRDAFQATLLWNGHQDGRALQSMTVGAPQQLTPICEVYAERFRKQKAAREAFIRKALREVFRLQSGHMREKFAELLAILSAAEGKENGAAPLESGDGQCRRRQAKPSRRIRVVEVKVEDDKEGVKTKDARAREARVDPEASIEAMAAAAFAGLSTLERCQLLYAQFIAITISALPFAYESEPLLVVFECNRHLSLHAGALAATFGKGVDESGDEEMAGEREALRPRDIENGAVQAQATKKAAGARVATNAPEATMDAFGEALAILACIVLKGAVKAEYGLTAEQCMHFNPKDTRQERIRLSALPGYLAARSVANQAGSGGNEDAPSTTSRMRFPVEEWTRLAAQFAANARNPTALAAQVRSLTDSDPWDSSVSRHAAVLERVESRHAKRGRTAQAEAAPVEKATGSAKTASRGRGRGVARKGGPSSGRGKESKRPKLTGGGQKGDADCDYEGGEYVEVLDDEDVD